jgi:hypothetical protein
VIAVCRRLWLRYGVVKREAFSPDSAGGIR